MASLDVSDLGPALEDDQADVPTAPAPALRAVPEPVEGWVEAEAVDYSAMESTSATHTFGGNAAIYEWNDEYGDVGPKFPELEIDLFGDPESRDKGPVGLDFSKYASLNALTHYFITDIILGSPRFQFCKKVQSRSSPSRLLPMQDSTLLCSRTSSSLDMRSQLLSRSTPSHQCFKDMMSLVLLRLVMHLRIHSLTQ